MYLVSIYSVLTNIGTVLKSKNYLLYMFLVFKEFMASKERREQDYQVHDMVQDIVLCGSYKQGHKSLDPSSDSGSKKTKI